MKIWKFRKFRQNACSVSLFVTKNNRENYWNAYKLFVKKYFRFQDYAGNRISNIDKQAIWKVAIVLTKLISGNILFISEDAKKIPPSWVIEQRLGPAQPVSNHATSWGWVLWDKNLNQSVRCLATFAFWDKRALHLYSSRGCLRYHESWFHWP